MYIRRVEQEFYSNLNILGKQQIGTAKVAFEEELPELTSTEKALTGNGITERHVTGSDRVCMHNRFPCIFLTIVVVQNVSLHMAGSSMATGCDVIKCHVTPRGSPGRVGCVHAQPEVARYPIKRHTRRACPGKYGSAHAVSEVSLRCYLGHSDHKALSFSTNQPFHWLSSPFPPFYFHRERLQFFQCFRIYSLQTMLCSISRVSSITSAFSLWYFYKIT